MQGITRDAAALKGRNQEEESRMKVCGQTDQELRTHLANILKIPPQAFNTLNQEQMITIIRHAITNNNSNAIRFSYNHRPVFHLPDKLMEAFKEVNRPNAEVISAKEEQIKLLERMLSKK